MLDVHEARVAEAAKAFQGKRRKKLEKQDAL